MIFASYSSKISACGADELIPNGCCMNHDLCTIIIHNSSYELGSVSNALDPMHWTGLPHPHRDFIAFSWEGARVSEIPIPPAKFQLYDPKLTNTKF